MKTLITKKWIMPLAFAAMVTSACNQGATKNTLMMHSEELGNRSPTGTEWPLGVVDVDGETKGRNQPLPPNSRVGDFWEEGGRALKILKRDCPNVALKELFGQYASAEVAEAEPWKQKLRHIFELCATHKVERLSISNLENVYFFPNQSLWNHLINNLPEIIKGNPGVLFPYLVSLSESSDKKLALLAYDILCVVVEGSLGQLMENASFVNPNLITKFYGKLNKQDFKYIPLIKLYKLAIEKTEAQPLLARIIKQLPLEDLKYFKEFMRTESPSSYSTMCNDLWITLVNKNILEQDEKEALRRLGNTWKEKELEYSEQGFIADFAPLVIYCNPDLEKMLQDIEKAQYDNQPKFVQLTYRLSLVVVDNIDKQFFQEHPKFAEECLTELLTYLQFYHVRIDETEDRIMHKLVPYISLGCASKVLRDCAEKELLMIYDDDNSEGRDSDTKTALLGKLAEQGTDGKSHK